jgi:sigma-B regulation protein RsbU (phosphoserine phosphatase)
VRIRWKLFWLLAAPRAGAEAGRDALPAALDAFRGVAPREDDVTLVVVAITA